MDCVFFKVQNGEEENIDDLSLPVKHDRFFSASSRDKSRNTEFFQTRYRLESIVNMLLRCIKLRECRVKHRNTQLNAFILCDVVEHNNTFQVQL